MLFQTPLELATALKEEGNKHFKNSQFEEAISSYEKAIEICPEKETISLATFYQNKAAAYEQLVLEINILSVSVFVTIEFWLYYLKQYDHPSRNQSMSQLFDFSKSMKM